MLFDEIITDRMTKGEMDALLDQFAERALEMGAEPYQLELSLAGALFRVKADYYRQA